MFFMGNINKNQLILLLLSLVGFENIITSDTEGLSTPRAFRCRISQSQLNPIGEGFLPPHDSIGNSPYNQHSSPFGLSSSGGSQSSPYIERKPFSETPLFAETPVYGKGRRSCTPQGSCTPPQTPLQKALPEQVSPFAMDASPCNQKYAQAIESQLAALKNGRQDSVELWRTLINTLKGIKDSPQKPDAKRRTIVRISRAVVEEAFGILQKKCPLPEAQIGALFKAEIVEDAAKLFEDSPDISNLPAWIVKKCFEKVQSDCDSPQRHVVLRDNDTGLPVVRSTHIVHGHSLLQGQGKNIAPNSILMDPKTCFLSLVWKKFQKIDDKGSLIDDLKGQDVRKALFPQDMDQDSINACILRAVQSPKKGVSIKSACELSLYEDPKTGLFIQTIESAGGSLVGTAYPVRILTKKDYADKKNSLVPIMTKISTPQDKKGDNIRISEREILSKVRLSDRIMADCGDIIVVDIGHVDPLYSSLIENPSKDFLTSSPSKQKNVQQALPQTPSKGKKGKTEPVAAATPKASPSKGRGKDQDDDFTATSVRSDVSIAKYCPIGVEVSLDDLQTLNKQLYEDVQNDRLDRQKKAAAKKALGVFW